MDDLQAHSIARDWLTRWAEFVNCSVTGVEDAVKSVFLEEGWLRDLLVLGDDFHTAHGHGGVAQHLRRCMTQRHPGIHDIRLDTDTSQGGAYVEQTPGGVCVTMFFLLDRTCPDLAAVRGCARLMMHDGTWKAWTVLLMLHNFDGFEESFRRDGRTANTEMPWDDVLEEERAVIEADPEVLIVGAGHNGMMTAARLRRLGIRTLIVDRTEDVGSNWSNRYERLRLHTPAFMNTFPYQDFPSTWPKYLPKSRVASFLRFYAESQDLTIWTSTTVSREAPPAYDADTQRWEVHLERSGNPIIVRPRHLVLATGWLGLPRDLWGPAELVKIPCRPICFRPPSSGEQFVQHFPSTPYLK